ncbi:MAG: hypothetical protein EA385_11580 [Salinarimonadaceae bacterium]|nr:MAG: hypothetical protein EA385_11580 [Salinarimonadaceae bacterium]
MVRRDGAAALVRVHAVRGSAPRDVGACMAVRPDGAFHGTIGGGSLEWEALADARAALADGRGPARFRDYALGPDLGQCCGGRAVIGVETFDARDEEALATLAAAERNGTFAVECALDIDGRVMRAILSSEKGAEEGQEIKR